MYLSAALILLADWYTLDKWLHVSALVSPHQVKKEDTEHIINSLQCVYNVISIKIMSFKVFVFTHALLHL
jgi:hypothetical protein